MRAAATFILRWLLMTGLLLLAAAGPSSAVPGEAGQQRVALVVGNTQYRSVAPLKNAVRDSRDIAATLRGLGFEVIEANDASLSEFQAALERFYRASSDADAAVFYYSGHGFQLNGVNYLVPVDAALTDRSLMRTETIGLDEIAKKSHGRKRQTLIFIDACRNNPLPSSLQAAGSGEGLAQLETGSGTFIAFATQPGNITRDGAGDHSPFASALLEHMPTPGISISDMMIRVRNSVEIATLHTQTPWDQSSLRSQFYFNPVPEEDDALTAEDREILLSLDPEMRRKFESRFGLDLKSASAQDLIPIAANEAALVPGLRIEAADDPVADAVLEADETGGSVLQPTIAAAPLVPTLQISPGTSNTATVVNGAPSGPADGDLPSAVASPQREPSVRQPVAVSSSSESASALATAAAAIGNVSSYDPVAAIAAATRTLRAASQGLRTQGSLASAVTAPAEPSALTVDLAGNGADRPGKDIRDDEVAGLSSEERSIAVPSAASDSLSPVVADIRRIVGEEVVPPVVVPELALPKPGDLRIAALDPRAAASLSAGESFLRPKPPLGEGEAALPADLPRAVQQELLRLGCYRSRVDEEWGSGSARALLRYYATKRIEPDVLEPGAELYARLSGENEVVCTRTETRPEVRQPVRTKPSNARPPRSEPRQQAARPPRTSSAPVVGTSPRSQTPKKSAPASRP